jgi:hypothetical protein
VGESELEDAPTSARFVRERDLVKAGPFPLICRSNQFSNTSCSRHLAIQPSQIALAQMEQTIVYWIYQLTKSSRNLIVLERGGCPGRRYPG